ncbi:MAG: MmgE/PrpD family protein [Halobacteriales archaeon]
MATTAELADFAASVSCDDLHRDVREELKKRLLDSLGIAVGALGAPPTDQVLDSVTELERGGPCTLWGREARASPVGAAMHNTALTRYLDFMDSFLAPGETPHPSDNIAAVVAVAESRDADGPTLLEGIGTAYEVQAELAWNAPVRDRGFDHVTHTVISAATAAGTVAGLDREAMRNAIGIAGTAHNALRVTRTGGINEWKGIACANAARNAVYSVILASNGMEGPVNLFEGQKGWKEVISGDFEVDLDPGCTRVFDTMTKRYVAETYAQSAVEGIIELAEANDIDPREVERIDLETFHGAALIIGGGEGDRTRVRTKAEADHSLPYMLAAALIDREMSNAAYEPARIRADDVQRLLKRVEVHEVDELTERFEADEMPANLEVHLADGTVHRVEKDDFGGHPNNPMDWDQIEAKFAEMTRDRYDAGHRRTIVETVRNLEDHDVRELVACMN